MKVQRREPYTYTGQKGPLMQKPKIVPAWWCCVTCQWALRISPVEGGVWDVENLKRQQSVVPLNGRPTIPRPSSNRGSLASSETFVKSQKPFRDIPKHVLQAPSLDPSNLRSSGIILPKLQRHAPLPAGNILRGMLLEVLRAGVPVAAQHGWCDSSALWVWKGVS